MALGDILGAQSFVNNVADIIGINDWTLQEAYYNGALFHWMQPSYTGINPVAGLLSYAQNDLGDSPQKPNFSTWSNLSNVHDSLSRKLVVYSVPNYPGYYIEDYGSTGVTIELVGIVFGTDYMAVLDKCLTAFNDEPVSIGSIVGVQSGYNFRILNHPVFGKVNNVYLKDYELVTSSDKFQAASFKLTLLASDPSFLTNPTITSVWQQEAQNILAGAQNILSGITQTFSLGQSLVSGVIPSPVGFQLTSSMNNAYVNLPIIDGQGIYLNSIIAEVQAKLQTLANTFQNCLAFLVQNDGEVVTNPFWNSVIIDYSILPLYLAPGQKFTASDAQVLLTFYNAQIETFNTYAEQNGFSYNLQNNIFSVTNSISAMSAFSQVVLTQNNESVMVLTKSNTDLYTLMSQNQVTFDKLDKVNFTNNGSWLSSIVIPPGITVDMS